MNFTSKIKSNVFLIGLSILTLGSLTACGASGPSAETIKKACNDSYQVEADYLNLIAQSLATSSSLPSSIVDEYKSVADEWEPIANLDKKYSPILEMYVSRETDGTPTSEQKDLFSTTCPFGK